MIIRDVRIPFARILLVGFLPSFLKKLIYRWKGYRIGRGVSFAPGSVLDVDESCTIGDHTRFGFFSIINAKRLQIGSGTRIRSLTLIMVPDVEIGDDVVISETAIIRTQLPFHDSKLVIGDRAHIFPYTIIDPSRPVTIGPESAVGFASYIFSHGAYKNQLDGYPVSFGEVNIGKAVWLPCRVFIMPGVTLGDDVVVGTGSVVTRSLDDGVFALGQPAQVLKTREDFTQQYTDEEKLSLLQQILAEFARYAEHFGDAKIRTQEPGTLDMQEMNGSVLSIRVVDSPTQDNFNEPPQILLSLKTISAEARRQLNAADTDWFSYEDHACSSTLSENGVLFREYLTRYGLMFARGRENA